jgi:hypothetical protein
VWSQTSLLPWWSGWQNSCLKRDKQKESEKQMAAILNQEKMLT